MKILLLSATYLVGLAEMFLGFYFWRTNSGDAIRKTMTLLCISTGLWVTLSAFAAYKGGDDLFNLTINRLLIVFGLVLVTSLLHLTILFPFPTFRFDRLHLILLYIPAFLLSVIALFTDAIVMNVVANVDYAGVIIGGPIYPIANFFVLAMYVISVIMLFKKVRISADFHRRNVKTFLVGLLVGGVPAIYIDLIAPIFHLPEPNYLIGALTSVFWLGAICYILLLSGRRLDLRIRSS